MLPIYILYFEGEYIMDNRRDFYDTKLELMQESKDRDDSNKKKDDSDDEE